MARKNKVQPIELAEHQKNTIIARYALWAQADAEFRASRWYNRKPRALRAAAAHAALNDVVLMVGGVGAKLEVFADRVVITPAA